MTQSLNCEIYADQFAYTENFFTKAYGEAFDMMRPNIAAWARNATMLHKTDLQFPVWLPAVRQISISHIFHKTSHHRCAPGYNNLIAAIESVRQHAEAHKADSQMRWLTATRCDHAKQCDPQHGDH